MTQFSPDVITCADLVRDADPVRFRAIMATPAHLRRPLFVIFAFNIDVARAAWASNEPMIGEMRLQWWYDALEEIAQGGIVRRHPVITELALLIDAAQAHRLQTLVAARRWDLYRDPFDKADAMQAYIADTSAPLYEVATALLTGAPARPTITHIGTAIGVANFLVAAPDLIAAGRQPFFDRSDQARVALADQALTQLAGAGRLTRMETYACLSGYLCRARLRQARRSPNAHPSISPLKDSILLLKARTIGL